jgi:hypothetical protein
VIESGNMRNVRKGIVIDLDFDSDLDFCCDCDSVSRVIDSWDRVLYRTFISHGPISNSPERSHRIVSDPCMDFSTMNRVHEQIAQPLGGIHPYPTIPQVTSPPVLIVYQSP